MKQKHKEPPTLWLARDRDGEYSFFPGSKMPRASRCSNSLMGNSYYICSREFHRIFPNIRLKRGGGPIKIKLPMEVVE